MKCGKIGSIIYFIFLLLYSCQSQEMLPEKVCQCNGSITLCEKKYNDVVFACTHNAYNYSTEPPNFSLPNQSQSIEQQLNDGIRALMLDIHYADATIEAEDQSVWLYHSTGFVGYTSLKDELQVIANFLMNNPTEIVTIILECYVDFIDFKKAMEQGGLMPFVYQPSANGAWLSLQQMIDNNQRLVVLSDVKDANADTWYMYVWDVAFETDYNNKKQQDFSCVTNRGDAANDLFIFNHFITHSFLGTGLIDSSAVINQYDYLLNRAKECQSYYSQIPNFITVDFYDSDKVLEVVNELNEL